MHKVNFKLRRCICGRPVSKDAMLTQQQRYVFFVASNNLFVRREKVKSKLLMFTCRIIGEIKN